MRDNVKLHGTSKTYKNGTSVSFAGFGGEATIESDQPMDAKCNLPSQYSGTRKLSAPFLSYVSKDGEGGYAGLESELLSFKAGYYYGVDISINLNLSVGNYHINPPVGGNSNVTDNTSVRIYVPDEVPTKN